MPCEKNLSDSSQHVASNRTLKVPPNCRPVPHTNVIPKYRIDMSLPPSERYIELATAFAHHLRSIGGIFDDALKTHVPFVAFRAILKCLARIALRRVYSPEETEELRSIANVSGVELYLLVVLNMLLDCQMGCTSGGVLTSTKDGPARMMHFRTLDWGMDGLRDLLVVLEFVRSDGEEPERVIGRSVTYAGFVGLVTGVKENLSISLNNRPLHDCSSLHVYAHQLLVLLGRRPSTSSILRSVLLPDLARPSLNFQQVVAKLSHQRATPCYIILSDGRKTTCIENDLQLARPHSSSELIIQTNHDTSGSFPNHTSNLLKESKIRHTCINNKWVALKSDVEEKYQLREADKSLSDGKEKTATSTYPFMLAVPEDTVKLWLQAFPTMNGETHYACLLDPVTAEIRILERGSWIAAYDSAIEVIKMLAEEQSMILDLGNKDDNNDEKCVLKLEEGKVIDPREILREQEMMILDLDHVPASVSGTVGTDADQVTLGDPEILKQGAAVLLEDDQATLTDTGAESSGLS